MSAASPPSDRPRLVTVAFWTLLVGAVLLILAGLLVATVSFELLREVAPDSISDDQLRQYLLVRRVVGVLYALVGATLAVLTGQLRRRDPRFRRATVALALAAVAVVAALTVFVGTGIVPMIGMLPVIVGAVLLTRPAAIAWFQDSADRGEP